jgi:hypothetical protein
MPSIYRSLCRDDTSDVCPYNVFSIVRFNDRYSRVSRCGREYLIGGILRICIFAAYNGPEATVPCSLILSSATRVSRADRNRYRKHFIHLVIMYLESAITSTQHPKSTCHDGTAPPQWQNPECAKYPPQTPSAYAERSSPSCCQKAGRKTCRTR